MNKLTREEKYKLARDSIRPNKTPKQFFLPRRPISKTMSDYFLPRLEKPHHRIPLPKTAIDRFSLKHNIYVPKHTLSSSDIELSKTTSIPSSESSETCEGDFDPSFSILSSDCMDRSQEMDLIDKFNAILDIIVKDRYFSTRDSGGKLGKYMLQISFMVRVNDTDILSVIDSIKSDDEEKTQDGQDILSVLVSEDQWKNCILFEIKKYLKLYYNSETAKKDKTHKKDVCDWLKGKTQTKVDFTVIYEDGRRDDSDSENLHIDSNCRFVYNFLDPRPEHIHKYKGSTLYFKNDILNELTDTDSVHSEKLWKRYIPKKKDTVKDEIKVLTNKPDKEWQLHFPPLKYIDEKTGIEKIRQGVWHRKDRYRSNSFLKRQNLIRPRIFAKIDFPFRGDPYVSSHWVSTMISQVKPGGLFMKPAQKKEKETSDLRDFHQFAKNNTIWNKENYYS